MNSADLAGSVRHQATLLLVVLLLGLFTGPASAYLDLQAAKVETLGNGLTVIVLEDQSFPVVSVQMLYKAGARNEPIGASGLAHFLEHMAFRSSENFPDTEMVSSIYRAGGEWHGYTWLDQTTYFATVPKAELRLLLRIEADRMAKLDIPVADLDSERGAILTEMHSYQNNPATVLHDYVLYVSFLAHPYRNNTIGWESDIANISHSDLKNFYETHYQPGNTVLSIVGDVRTDDVMQEVRQYFAEMEGQPASPAPHTVEPQQSGERRVRLKGTLDRKYFKIAYRAPSVSHPDYAAFLLIQELLAGGSGISFLQNDWGTSVRPDSVLAGISDDLTTWFPPSAQEYIFIISGSVPGGSDESTTEKTIEAGIERLRQQFKEAGSDGTASLARARQRVLRELTFDLQTTEDAAHQLAFFAGLDALGVLIQLEELLKQVSVADIDRVFDHYLRSEKRTIGWYVPDTAKGGTDRTSKAPVIVQTSLPSNSSNVSATAPKEAATPARLETLTNGIPVIIQRSPLSPTAMLRVIVSSANFSLPAGVSESQPAWGLSSLDFERLPNEIAEAISQAGSIIGSARPKTAVSAEETADPLALLESTFTALLGLQYPEAAPIGPLLLVVAGDIDPTRVLEQLDSGFGRGPAAKWVLPEVIRPAAPVELEKHMSLPIAQEQLGYLVQVPDPGENTRDVWQMVLYILTHGYEGRLGKAAISQRGLVYYIDSAYHTDGKNDWITLNTGVDPNKLSAMKTLLREQLELLITVPPSPAEIEAARSYLLGRYVSAAQSNQELTEKHAWQWILSGSLTGYADLKRRLDEVDVQDLIQVLAEFTQGSIVAVRNPAPDKEKQAGR